MATSVAVSTSRSITTTSSGSYGLRWRIDSRLILRGHRVMSRPPATDLHGDIHPRAKPVNDPHETVYRESAKICIPHSREISRSYAREAMRLSDTQAIPIERLNNFCGQDRLELFYIRVLFTEIPKHIAATAYHFKLFLF